MTDAYLQMVLALIGVLGLIVLIGFFMRKKRVTQGFMTVLAYQSFGPRKGVAALKIGGEVLLVGVTATDLKLLKTLRETDLEPETVRDISDKLHRLRRIKGELNEHK